MGFFNVLIEKWNQKYISRRHFMCLFWIKWVCEPILEGWLILKKNADFQSSQIKLLQNGFWVSFIVFVTAFSKIFPLVTNSVWRLPIDLSNDQYQPVDVICEIGEFTIITTLGSRISGRSRNWYLVLKVDAAHSLIYSLNQLLRHPHQET